jgi:glucokinase
MKKYIIGIDIGGTKIATGLVTEEGKIFCKVVLPTLSSQGADVSLGQVYRSVEEVIKKAAVSPNAVSGIGACAPGPLDPVKGVVHNPPNLDGWKNVPLAALLKKRFKVRTKIENDANAAGMAEVTWGAAKGYKHVFYVTVSTGIGTAIIIDRKIYHGKNGMAGEGGHVTIKFDDRTSRCNCGNTGCIEALASGTYTVKRLVEKIKRTPGIKTSMIDLAGGSLDGISMKTVARAAAGGDKLAIETINEQGRLIGVWLGGMISLIDPEIIVIGGGVSLIGKAFFSPVREAAPTHTINIFAKDTPIVQAKLRKDVGIYGAASVLLKK